MSISKKQACISNSCVACGNCVKYCPLNAISVYKGMYATVDTSKCVGCSKCITNCPAGVIKITTREDNLI